MRWMNWKDSRVSNYRRRFSIGAKCNHQGHFFWKQQPMRSNYTSGTHKELCLAKCNHHGHFFWKQQPMWSKYTSGTYKELYLSENNLACSDKFNSSDNHKITPSGKSHNRWRSSVQRFWLVIVICARKLQTDQQPIRNSTMTSLGLRHGRVSWISSR